ncbi:MAG TPA: hypothetical protein VGV14_10255 [Rhodanobacter sp.]|nr:hypothetical protein [Rhodanobacter sp.]
MIKTLIAVTIVCVSASALAQQNSDATHQSGYVWASKHDIDDPGMCTGKSKSFIEGCIEYATARRKSMAIEMVRSGKPRVLTSVRTMQSTCSSNSHKCQAVCDAGERLRSASEDLATCAASHDYNDSCDSQFNDVRDAHDGLESAVTDSASDCE